MADFFKHIRILLVMIFFSGTITSTIVMSRARRESNIQTVAAYGRIAGFAGPFLIGLPLTLVGIFGVLTSWKEHYSLTGTGWINAAYASLIIGWLAGNIILGGHTCKVAGLAEHDLGRGKKSEELQTELDKPLAIWLGAALQLLVLWIIYLMVFKPF